ALIALVKHEVPKGAVTNAFRMQVIAVKREEWIPGFAHPLIVGKEYFQRAQRLQLPVARAIVPVAVERPNMSLSGMEVTLHVLLQLIPIEKEQDRVLPRLQSYFFNYALLAPEKGP